MNKDSKTSAELLEYERKEKLAYEKLVAFDQVNNFANRIGMSPMNSDIKPIVQEFINFYENLPSHSKELYREAPDFNFIIGMIAYYLSNETNIDTIKDFFFSITGKIMSVENGIQCIKQSNCENAYWFLETYEEN